MEIRSDHSKFDPVSFPTVKGEEVHLNMDTKFVVIDQSTFRLLRSISPRHLSVNEYVDELMRTLPKGVKGEEDGDYYVSVGAVRFTSHCRRSNSLSVRITSDLFNRLQKLQRIMKRQLNEACDISSLLQFNIIIRLLNYKQLLASPLVMGPQEDAYDFSRCILVRQLMLYDMKQSKWYLQETIYTGPSSGAKWNRYGEREIDVECYSQLDSPIQLSSNYQLAHI